jgi:hypothetical protein
VNFIVDWLCLAHHDARSLDQVLANMCKDAPVSKLRAVCCMLCIGLVQAAAVWEATMAREYPKNLAANRGHHHSTTQN